MNTAPPYNMGWFQHSQYLGNASMQRTVLEDLDDICMPPLGLRFSRRQSTYLHSLATSTYLHYMQACEIPV